MPTISLPPDPTALPADPVDHEAAGPPGFRPEGGTISPGLHIVATPIGNLADLSPRALAVLRAADLIACEDTRVSGTLLARHAIATRRVAYHDHNADRVRPQILEVLAAGGRVALISDAGTPLVSDPGYKLVRAVVAAGIRVSAVPGPSALLAALVLSGLPTDRFLFAGFLPPKSAARRGDLEDLKSVRATLVFFESARRLEETLADLLAVLGDREAAVARELTKLFEEVRRDRLSAVLAHYRAAGAPKGEIVIVVGPPEASADAAVVDLDGALQDALGRLSLRDAADAVAAATQLPRRQVYARALELAKARERP